MPVQIENFYDTFPNNLVEVALRNGIRFNMSGTASGASLDRLFDVLDSFAHPLIISSRISEAAFACGFQSMTNYNRAFERIVGRSPTQFRDRFRSCYKEEATKVSRLTLVGRTHGTFRTLAVSVSALRHFNFHGF
jgi:hypothetical protein